MSTVAKLLVQKQQVMEQLEKNPGPNEREEIERILAKIEIALSSLGQGDSVAEGE
ncbi:MULTISPECIES: hypothetical protein [unclassified Bradyrhizobium]|uniref:hypothetical protein n=1 Tax=unclassified Bradyrhizobium TaxID=2631580 RepID=UPI001FFC04B3|nr:MULTISPECIES: hypothetical protein [unclassified Bradyrhizobium]MCK1537556.1 hypothetical protein [Bradyrhizobium sp. 176]MCK1554944.1 hypothetical protein [Bradyrhizobium sp. 171]UPJ28893.1 hypothetical protein IVB54_07560 [Bradyrhizobium sp. CW1]